MEGCVITLVRSSVELEAAFDLMRELRPDLEGLTYFIEQVNRQVSVGYRLYGLWNANKIIGLVGIRISENLLYGRHLYVDDLVIDSTTRGLGYGSMLLNKAREEAASANCRNVVLDTGIQKKLAQKFYLREGMIVKGVHFVQHL